MRCWSPSRASCQRRSNSALRSALESLNGEHCDVAVLRVDPAKRGIRCAPGDGHDQDARPPAETHSRGVLHRFRRTLRGCNQFERRRHPIDSVLTQSTPSPRGPDERTMETSRYSPVATPRSSRVRRAMTRIVLVQKFRRSCSSLPLKASMRAQARRAARSPVRHRARGLKRPEGLKRRPTTVRGHSTTCHRLEPSRPRRRRSSPSCPAVRR